MRRSIIVGPSTSWSAPVAGVASIVDAMEEIALDGVVAGCGRVITSTRLHGPVATLRMAAVEKVGSPTQEHWQLFDQSAAASVLVIATGGADFTVLGGVSAAVAAARGVAGIVTDGGVRDIDEIEGTGMPVRFAHHSPRSCTGEFDVVDVGEPIVLGGQCITPGDYLVADSDGLVVIPARVTDSVLMRADEIERRETAWARAAVRHKSIAAGYADIYTTAGTAGMKEK